mgnify:CR=1 FL=1
MLDRIDIHVELPRVSFTDLRSDTPDDDYDVLDYSELDDENNRRAGSTASLLEKTEAKSERRREDAQDHGNQGGGIGLQVTEQPQESLFGIFGFAAVTAHSHRRHYASPPFIWDS